MFKRQAQHRHKGWKEENKKGQMMTRRKLGMPPSDKVDLKIKSILEIKRI